MRNTSCRKICPLPHPGTPSASPWNWKVCKREWLEQRGQYVEEYMFMLQECRRTELPLTSGGGRRRWDEMPTDILFKIFLRVPLYFLLHNIAYVCRSWRSSVLDVLFPSTGVLSLQTLDTLPVYLCDIYLHLLKVLLNTRPQFQWHTFISPCEFLLPYTAVTYIAQRRSDLSLFHLD
ncbi:hypothetical protein IFM89_010534 [Coptis chinensis]|uniref:F-box domain-containing protein n=1 Tax=Coptis chinensis TaxID=261450 RepID=A0A835HT42_9MAGN|nr:hypothetical protein IFM89_010534 [Coptis chinensis]